MNARTRRIAVVLIAGLLCLSLAGAASYALGLGNILKVGGIAFLVSQYGDQIDRFVTSSLGERGAAAHGATKVVPILSLGGGGYIGAAQVVGSPENVRKTKAVFQVEGRIGSFTPRIFVPAYVNKATTTPERAKGVGVSAVIEFRI